MVGLIELVKQKKYKITTCASINAIRGTISSVLDIHRPPVALTEAQVVILYFFILEYIVQ